MTKNLDIYTDGASRGNPGLAAIGVVIKENGKIVKELSQTIGTATNNVAEYTALIYALQEALMLKAQTIKVFTDSELMYQQLKGIYKVKTEHIKQLFEQVEHLFKGFASFKITHIPREKNRDADALANKAIKKEQAKVVASSSSCEGEESPSSKG